MRLIKNTKRLINFKAFTIVELLVVIVVIGILATLVFVSYSGMQDKANAAVAKADLTNAATKIKLYHAEHDLYPNSIDDCPTPADGNICLSLSSIGTFEYSVDNSSSDKTFSLIETITSSGISYQITNDTEPTVYVATKPISIGGVGEHACTIKNDGLVYCWGYNYFGQLGNNSTSNRTTPAQIYYSGVLSGKTIENVFVGAYHTCAIDSGGIAYCWGYNQEGGQLGNGSTTDSPVPVAVDMTGVLSGKTIKSMHPGRSHTCVIASDNKAYCWGDNGNNQLGNGSTTDSPVPVAVDMTGVLLNKTIKSMTAGYHHTCVVASDNKVYCWGYNFRGQLGIGNTNNSSVPIAVSTAGVLNGKTIKSVSSGNDHTCAIDSNNLAYCWGSNFFGELANTPINTALTTPVAVPMTGLLSGKTIKKITLGYWYTCAIASDDNAYCWGRNYYGQLGNGLSGDANNSTNPVLVQNTGVLNGKTVKSITSGDRHVCVIASDDKVYCWGAGDAGKLGNGGTSNSSIPVAVSGF